MGRLTENVLGNVQLKACRNDLCTDYDREKCCNNFLVQKAFEKLAEYENLEEQGKLLQPKCIPGDYVWEINKERNIISEYEVSSIRYGINFRWIPG